MTGKEKCKLLRQMRKEIAAINEIPYFPTECTYEGDDCKGSCPMCEAEAAYLDRALNEKAARGATIRLSGVCLDTFNDACPEPVAEDEIFFEEAGVMACDEEPPQKEPMDKTIEEMPFSADCLQALKQANIHTVAQLLQTTYTDLEYRHNIPFSLVYDIRKVLAQAGLFLPGSSKPQPLTGVMIPENHTPGYMVPNDEDRNRRTRSDERLKGAMRPRDFQRIRDTMDLQDLGISVRTARILLRSDIRIIADLIAMSTDEIAGLDGIRKRHLDEIIRKVHAKGLYFKGETR